MFEDTHTGYGETLLAIIIGTAILWFVLKSLFGRK